MLCVELLSYYMISVIDDLRLHPWMYECIFFHVAVMIRECLRFLMKVSLLNGCVCSYKYSLVVLKFHNVVLKNLLCM